MSNFKLNLLRCKLILIVELSLLKLLIVKPLRGPVGGGGSEVDFQFLLFLIEEDSSFQVFFFRDEKILFQTKLLNFQIAKIHTQLHTITYNNIAHANFNHDFPKINFKIYFLLYYSF